MRRFAVILLSVSAGISATFGCREASLPDAVPSSPNIIVVLVDTLRADHMSLDGYERPTTPFIDRFASEAIVFERARSQAACTFPSVNTLFTSRYAFEFYVQGENQMGIPAEYPTIAQVLRSRGYHTIAVSASPIVRSTPSKDNPNGGFAAGFDVFDESCLWRERRWSTRVRWSSWKTFGNRSLYLHYMDPHGDYAPPVSHQRRFAGPYEGQDFVAAGDIDPIADMLFNDGPKLEISDRDMQHLVDLYDDEILYFDGQLERLVASLRENDLLDRSLFVLTSDHGEEFLEHGQVGHCRGVWDTLTHVPLLMRFPDLGGGGRTDAPVQLVDVVPTVLDELGFDAAAVPLEAYLPAPDDLRRRSGNDKRVCLQRPEQVPCSG